MPCARAEVENTAAPELIGTVASTVAPSRNCTVPVAAGFTVAVKVTDWPTVDGFTLETNVNAAVSFTVWMMAAEVDAALFASPLYTAVMERVPWASVEVVNEADPPASAPVPRTVLPSTN